MITKVTKESLAENIGRLESYGDLSLNEEYQLAAYRMLYDHLKADEFFKDFASKMQGPL